MEFAMCLFFTLVSMITSSLALFDVDKQPKKCQEQKSYQMLGYFCNNLNLDFVPKKMRSSIEILELSYNRIRNLDSESFAPCQDVKFIYLQYNILSSIQKGTFTQLKKLEVLDLSENVLRDVPGEIFDLPLLRHLYLERNSFGLQSFDTIPKTIKAPLKLLNIANNNLDTIPKQFGILPNLHHLNISSNRMLDLRPQQFSPFCNLKYVDLKNTQMDKCKCIEVTDFLLRRDIDLSSFFCKEHSAECQRSPSNFNETEDYQICISITRQVIADKEAKLTWGVIGLSVLAFMIFFIGILYCIHRSNVKQMRNRMKINNTHAIISIAQSSPNTDESTQNSPEKLLIKKSDI